MISEVVYIAYLSYLIEGDKSKCASIAAHLLEGETEITEIYTGLFQRSMQRIGKSCAEGKACIADEHIATAITESLMSLAYPKICQKICSENKVVVSCVPKEFHQIGARMVSDIFELNGWKSYFLGSNTPLKEICRVIDNVRPDVLALSVGFHINLVRFLELIDHVRKHYPGLKIFAGGMAFSQKGYEEMKNIQDVTFFSSIKELDNYLKSQTTPMPDAK